MQFNRFGIYFTPKPGVFAAKGATWLGWDIAHGRKLNAVGGQHVARPQKYGFHATIKPPCRLCETCNLKDVAKRLDQLCETIAPVQAEALTVEELGSFLALVPASETEGIRTLAAHVVRNMDAFRATPTKDEQQRRKRPGMSQTMLQNIDAWGYPHVMDLFRFHMTLTGPVAKAERPVVKEQIEAHFGQSVPAPFVIDSLTLVGEADDAMFYEISRHALRG